MGQEFFMRKRQYLTDTDILIDYLKGYDDAINFFKHHSSLVVLSSINVAELYAGVRNKHELDELDVFLKLFPIYSVTPEIAKRAGIIKRDFSKSHGIGLADCLIAATCDIYDITLVTLNNKHFPMIENIQIPYRK